MAMIQQACALGCAGRKKDAAVHLAQPFRRPDGCHPAELLLVI